ncbi:hypothetical protein B0H10DRAFT_2234227 [Mycena sp. CBHHK59/15]|nr:hypothetical protein B0H10DRAFT_2234227 [Mycena sp. CBHHK59/15]
MSCFAPRTLIRTISTPLRTRTAPPIPPAGELKAYCAVIHTSVHVQSFPLLLAPTFCALRAPPRLCAACRSVVVVPYLFHTHTGRIADSRAENAGTHPALLLFALSQCALTGLYVLHDVCVFPCRVLTQMHSTLLLLLAVPIALTLPLRPSRSSSGCRSIGDARSGAARCCALSSVWLMRLHLGLLRAYWGQGGADSTEGGCVCARPRVRWRRIGSQGGERAWYGSAWWAL